MVKAKLNGVEVGKLIAFYLQLDIIYRLMDNFYIRYRCVAYNFD